MLPMTLMRANLQEHHCNDIGIALINLSIGLGSQETSQDKRLLCDTHQSEGPSNGIKNFEFLMRRGTEAIGTLGECFLHGMYRRENCRIRRNMVFHVGLLANLSFLTFL